MNKNCFHCGLAITKQNKVVFEINNEKKTFCCMGCANICNTIFDSGFSNFYSKQESTYLTPKLDLEYPLEVYDLIEFQNLYLEENNKGIKTMTLFSETIHCAACVWLIEKIINQIDGVLLVRVNLTDKRIKISWQDEKTKLSEIIVKLANIGYVSTPYEESKKEIAIKSQNRKALYRIAFAAFTMMNLLWVSVALYSGAEDSKYQDFFYWLGFFLATPTLFYSGFPFLRNAYIGLKNLTMNMDLPISIGAITTYFYSSYILITDNVKGDIYFDTVVNFIFVISVGRYLESLSKKSAITSSHNLQQMQPKIAKLLIDNKEKIVPVNTVKIDDTLIIKSGEKIPLDAEVIKGDAEIDESLLTGEAKPVKKSKGSKVYAGTLNKVGALVVKVEKTVNKSTLSQIVRLVEDTKLKKGKISRIVDKVVPYFVFSTLSFALIAFVYWYQVSFDLALLTATAVLIITCPCALGLATPMSIAIAATRAAKDNILIKNPQALELLNNTKTIVFDKTGTLTQGKLTVNKVYSKIEKDKLLQITASIETYSEHLIGKSIINYAFKNGIKLINKVDNLKIKPGLGMSAIIDNTKFFVGNLNWLEKNNIKGNNYWSDLFKDLDKKSQTYICCADENNILGVITFNDALKDDAIEYVKNLQAIGKKIFMLTGDRENIAREITKDLTNIEIKADLLPHEKVREIKKLQKEDKVVMVGDGINDAPALTQADVGIAMSSAADISLQSADIIILQQKIKPIADVIKLARNTKKTIYQNITFAFFYNIIMIPLAMMAKVTPLFAAIAMPISSIIVIANSALLKKK